MAPGGRWFGESRARLRFVQSQRPLCGGVFRCLIADDEHGQMVVGIDDQQLRLEEFGRMLTTYGGGACGSSLGQGEFALDVLPTRVGMVRDGKNIEAKI